MSETEKPARKRSFLPLILSVAIGIAWLLSLLALTVAFSNPVTLNRAQILTSDAVLLGTFQGGEFTVSKAWGEKPVEDSIRLRNIRLVTAEIDEGFDYLVPITYSGEKIEITPSQIKQTPLIYPSSETLIDDLESLLTERNH